MGQGGRTNAMMMDAALVVSCLAIAALAPMQGVAGEYMLCGENQHVSGHNCVICAAGTLNRGGDDPVGPDTTCDGMLTCSSHEYLQGGVCKECPAGTAVQGSGTDPQDDALGLSISCAGFKCERPLDVPKGYDISGVNELSLEADPASFKVEGVQCAAGYEGETPSAVSCASGDVPEGDAHHPAAYGLIGCSPCPTERFRDRSPAFDGMPGAEICRMCHRCVTRSGREVVEHECTATHDRTCKCAPGFVGSASSPHNLAGSCERDVMAGPVHEEVQPPHAVEHEPVDAYNLGTLMAHCQIWVRDNHAHISVLNQHRAAMQERYDSELSAKRSSALRLAQANAASAFTPFFDENATNITAPLPPPPPPPPQFPPPEPTGCEDYCSQFASRMDATVCLGICDVAGPDQFIRALQATHLSDLDVCNRVFSDASY